MERKLRVLNALFGLVVILFGYLIMLYLANIFFCAPLRSGNTVANMPTPSASCCNPTVAPPTSFELASKTSVTSTARNIIASSTKSTVIIPRESLEFTDGSALLASSSATQAIKAASTLLATVTNSARTAPITQSPTSLIFQVKNIINQTPTHSVPKHSAIKTALSATLTKSTKAAAIVQSQTSLIFQVKNTNLQTQTQSTQVTTAISIPTATNQPASKLLESSYRANVVSCPNRDDYSPCVCSHDLHGYNLFCSNISMDQVSAIFNRTKPATFFLLDFKSLHMNTSFFLSNTKQVSHLKTRCVKIGETQKIKNRLEGPVKKSENAFRPPMIDCDTSLTFKDCPIDYTPNLFGLKQLTIQPCARKCSKISNSKKAGFQCLKIVSHSFLPDQNFENFIKRTLYQSKDTVEVFTLRFPFHGMPKAIHLFSRLKQLVIDNGQHTSNDNILIVDRASMNFKTPVDHVIFISPHLRIHPGALRGNVRNVTISLSSGPFIIRNGAFEKFLEMGGNLNFTSSKIRCRSTPRGLNKKKISGGICIESGKPFSNN